MVILEAFLMMSVFFVSSLTYWKNLSEPQIIKIQKNYPKNYFSFDLDKEQYYFGDKIKLKMHFRNFNPGDFYSLNLDMIEKKSGGFVLRKEREVNVKKRDYDIVYSVVLPKYSGCKGMEFGSQFLKLTLLKNQKVIYSGKKKIVLNVKK